MIRIGLLGGMSWESSLEYYRNINRGVKAHLGGTHSADCVMYSFDFSEVEDLQNAGDWDRLTKLMVQEARNLKSAGAQFIVICTNTMHLMSDAIEKDTGLKVLHIAEATANEIVKRQVDKVLLLGTKFTMEGDFYKNRLNNHDIQVVIPSESDREIVHRIIYEELVCGIIRDESKEAYKSIINKAISDGVTGVVLGCTEIPLLISSSDVDIEVFDTTSIHSSAAVDYSLEL